MMDRPGPLPAACAEHEANLVMRHYDELDAGTRAAVDTHVRECPDCAEYLKSLAALLSLTIERDEPPEEFWRDYDRELRDKLDVAAEHRRWIQKLIDIFQPRWVPAFATVAVVAVALTFTLGPGVWTSREQVQEDTAILELMPVAENLDFFNAMEMLDNLDVLESMGGQGNAA
jgi:anti-sigma factor RsiW